MADVRMKTVTDYHPTYNLCGSKLEHDIIALKGYKKEYPNGKLVLRQDDYSDSYSLYIQNSYERPMTAAEIKAEDEQKERNLKWEKDQFDRLKKKFEGKL